MNVGDFERRYACFDEFFMYTYLIFISNLILICFVIIQIIFREYLLQSLCYLKLDYTLRSLVILLVIYMRIKESTLFT